MDSQNKNKQSFKQVYKDFIYSSQFVVVLLLTLSQTVLVGFFQIYTKAEAYNDQDKVRVAMFSLVVTLVFSAILKAYCSFHMGKMTGLIEDRDLSSFTKRTFADWAIVEVRVQLRVLLGLLFFIIPGLIEALRLTLSLPIVFYDKRMEDQTFDPIHESRDILHMSNPTLWTLFSIVILAPVALHLILQNGNVSFFESPTTMLHASFAAFIFSLYTVYAYLYFTFLYKEAVLNAAPNTGEE